jgi:hypothetical protein
MSSAHNTNNENIISPLNNPDIIGIILSYCPHDIRNTANLCLINNTWFSECKRIPTLWTFKFGIEPQSRPIIQSFLHTNYSDNNKIMTDMIFGFPCPCEAQISTVNIILAPHGFQGRYKPKDIFFIRVFHKDNGKVDEQGTLTFKRECAVHVPLNIFNRITSVPLHTPLSVQKGDYIGLYYYDTAKEATACLPWVDGAIKRCKYNDIFF